MTGRLLTGWLGHWAKRFESEPVFRLLHGLKTADAYPEHYQGQNWQTTPCHAGARRLTWIVVIILGIVGYVHGSTTFSLHEDEARFYRHNMAPVINYTCTGKMAHYAIDVESQRFLNNETEVFESCDVVREAPNSNLWAPFDKQSTYFYFVTAGIWKVFGMSWGSLSIWAGVLGALYAIAAFLFVRVFSTSTILAASIALLLLYSDGVTKYIPDIRDFSKAPFTLLPLAFLGFALTRNLKPATIIALFGAVGFSVAVGQGFRPDTSVVVPIAAISALILLFRKNEPANWRLPLTALAVMSATLLLGSAPIALLSSMHEPVGNHSPHFFNLGYAEVFFETHLRMEASNYEQFRFYKDSFAQEHTIAFAGDPDLKRSSYGFPEYDRDGWANFFSTTSHFPHDAFMRAFYALRALMNWLPEHWWTSGLFGAALLSAGAAYNPRGALFLFFTAASLITISTLQFGERHYFHLPILFVALAVLGATSMISIVKDKLRTGTVRIDRAPTIAFGAFVVFVVSGSFELDRFLASHQSNQIDKLIGEYRSKSWSPVAFDAGPEGVRISIPDGASGLEMMKVTFSTAAPGEHSVLGLLNQVRGGILSESEAGLELEMSTEHGYQLTSEVMQYTPPPEGQGDRTVRVYIDLTTDAERIVVGALTGDGQRWLRNAKAVQTGAFKGMLEFPLAESVSDFMLVIEKPGAETGHLTIRRFDVLPEKVDCLPTEFTVLQQYGGPVGQTSRSSAEKFEPANQSEYYFPAVFIPNLYLSELVIHGTPASCVSGVSWAPIMPGDSKFELKLSDGEFRGPRTRGSFEKILPLIFLGDPRERKIEAWRKAKALEEAAAAKPL